jgi:hypothetical protein
VDLTKAIVEHPNVWAINEVFKVNGPKDLVNKYPSFGTIYMAIKFVTSDLVASDTEVKCSDEK